MVFGIKIFAQTEEEQSFRDMFEEANVLTDDKNYGLALPIWLKLEKLEPDNANINYRVGLCYFHSTQKSKAQPYLEKAVNDVTKNYDRFSYEEKKAPFETYYYLARIYHINYKIGKALETYNKFKELANKKHYLMKDIDHQMQMCLNAKELIGAPVDILKTNMGDKINSKYPEYSPVISLDEQSLFFTSRRLRKDSSNIFYKEITDGGFFEDIYVSYKDGNGEWGEPELLNINEPSEHYATVGISADGQTLYLYIDDEGDGNLYQSFLVGDRWTTPELVGEGCENCDINSKYQETHLTISADGRTMYFTSDRKGGYGGLDIYKSVKLPNGEWSKAQNMGPTINTPYDEDGPYLHADGKHLFFSSQGHKSIGGYDIFFSELRDDGTWTQPFNIGYPINTTDDDVFYVISPDGKRSYYSSFDENEGYGEKDLYILEQPEIEEPPLTLLKGHINVPEGQSLPDNVEIIVTDNETGEQVQVIKPIKRTGSYVIIIPPGKNYNIAYYSGDKEFYNENVYIPLESTYQEISKEIFLNPVKLGKGETGVVVVKSDSLNKAADSLKTLSVPRYQLRYTTLKKDIPEGLQVHYLDSVGNVMYTVNVEKGGFFEYKNLLPDQSVIFTIQPKNNVICDDLEIVLVDANEDVRLSMKADQKCIFKLPASVSQNLPKGRIKHKYINKKIPEGVIIQFLDENGKVYSLDSINPNGYFRYKELPPDKAYIAQLTPADKILCDEFEIFLTGSDEKSNIKLESDETCLYKVSTEHFVTKEIAYSHYFSYNTKDIDPADKEYSLLVDSILHMAESRGYIDISVESSASKVPTRTYKNNEDLAKFRAESGKKQLIEVLKSKGLDTSKINFVNTSTLVGGPKYNNDSQTNRAAYEKHQYLKLFITIKYTESDK